MLSGNDIGYIVDLGPIIDGLLERSEIINVERFILFVFDFQVNSSENHSASFRNTFLFFAVQWRIPIDLNIKPRNQIQSINIIKKSRNVHRNCELRYKHRIGCLQIMCYVPIESAYAYI